MLKWDEGRCEAGREMCASTLVRGLAEVIGYETHGLREPWGAPGHLHYTLVEKRPLQGGSVPSRQMDQMELQLPLAGVGDLRSSS